MESTKLLLTLIKPINYRSHLRIIMVFALIIIATICAVYLPLLLTRMIEVLQAGGTEEQVLHLFYWLSGALIIGRLCAELKFQIYAKWERQLMHSTLRFFHKKILLNRAPYFEDHSSGELTSRLALSAFGLKSFLFDIFFSILPLILEVGLIVSVIMHQMDIMLGGVLLAGISLYLITMVLLNRRLQHYQKKIREATVSMQGCLTDHFSSWKDIQLLNGFSRVSGQFEKYSSLLTEKTQDFYGKRTFFGIIQASFLILTFLLANYLTIESNLQRTTTIGGLVLINSYLFQLLRPLESFGLIYRSITHSYAEYGAILSALGKSPSAGTENLLSAPPAFVSLKLENLRKPGILSSINASWEKPACIALVGKTGSGKSALLNIIAGLDRNYEGSVLLGGSPIEKRGNAGPHQEIAYFPSDARLLSMPLCDNLLLSGSAEPTRIDRLLAAVNLTGRTSILGFDTVINESTFQLSTGEKQRLKLVRTLIANKPILLLDESTSALDPLTEEKVLDDLIEHNEGVMIFATHKFTGLDKFDTVILLDDGEPIEMGSHQSLLKHKGEYYNLWKTHQGNTLQKSS